LADWLPPPTPDGIIAAMVVESSQAAELVDVIRVNWVNLGMGGVEEGKKWNIEAYGFPLKQRVHLQNSPRSADLAAPSFRCVAAFPSPPFFASGPDIDTCRALCFTEATEAAVH
jgi:hypothetical protein